MPSEWENNSSSSSAKVSSSSASSLSASSSTATSPEPNANGNNNNNNDSAKNGHGKDCALKASTMSHDHTPYVARARVTRPTPPKPSCNPMQFVQIKPCNLYQSAQQQLKKAEEIKKVKEVMKEEPEDWQNNLDNWKSSRRKRVEHIIERVVEVKKLEEEEHDRTRRKSKTFSEMMEERGERGRTRPKLQSLASYNEDEANDLSDLGIGTSSASGKSSISEDCEVHSIVSEPAEVENLSSFDIENNSCQPCHDNDSRGRISSPGYETSSTAPVASPDPHEYTYEGAIEDYKSRVSKATASSIYRKADENSAARNLVLDRKSTDDTESSAAAVKMEDLPKIDISKKRELFEKPEVTKKVVNPFTAPSHEQIDKKRIPSEFANVRSIKDRMCSLEKKPESTDETATGILTGETPPSIKERLQCLEQQKQQNSVNPKPNTSKVVAEVVAVPPLKDRLSSLQNAVTKEEIVKKPVVLVDEYQLEMLKNEELARRQLELDTSKEDAVEKAPSDDSGINTTDEKIDHEPTEDEDGDDEQEEEEDDDKQSSNGRPQMHEEKVPPSASTNDFQGEFDSSVSFLQLKPLNTPTVVSLVDKPVVVDVVGGGGGDKSKIVPNDKNGEVNHAQNLLKMFKMAFDADDIVEESKAAEIVVGRDKSEGVGLINQEKIKDTGVPWRKPSEAVVKASKIPQGSAAKVEENTKKSVVQASKIPQGVSKAQISSPKIDQVEIEIPINTQADLGVVEIVKKSLSVAPVVQHPQAESEITKEANTLQEKKSRTSVLQKIKSIEGILKEDSNTCLKVSEPKQVKSHMTPGKVQPVTKPNESIPSNVGKPRTPVGSPLFPRKLESPISSRKMTAAVENVSRYGAKPHDLVSNLILNIDNNQKKSMIPVAAKSQQSSPITPVNSSPIYENVPLAGLKKSSSSDNNGRIEIFNSKSMPSKPKSPEVLPRGIKPNPPEDVKSEILSKDFQQTALNDFLGDLESWQPKIVGEQPKHSGEKAPIESVSKNSVSQSPEQIVQKTNVSPSEPPKSDEPLASPFTPEKQNDISKVLETKKNLPKTNVAPSEPLKSDEHPGNSRTPDDVSKVKERKKILESASKLPSPDKTVASTDPLPFESCVDMLQSFLAAERSHAVPAHPNEYEVVKKSNPSDVFLRQETVVEVPCSKLDVKDLPDPNFIRTPCIDVDCVTQSSQIQLRDSITSSAGDSSPSSEITVIFKPNASPTPGSPTPNKSSLMQIANRVDSPIAGRRNPPQPVHENPCLKLDVKDLPDPNFIRTPCINVDKKVLSECNATPSRPSSPSTPTSRLHKANAEVLKKTCDEISNTPPLSPVLGRASSPSVEKPNFLIARVEVVETKIKVTTSNDAEAPPAVPESQPPPMVVESPKLNRKSATNSKPKNIFEFLKKNFQSKPDAAAEPAMEEFKPISVDNSKFYVPSDAIASSTSKASPPSDSQTNNGVNIEIIKTITTDSIVEQTDSELNLTDEINEILDEEISKLVVEDANL